MNKLLAKAQTIDIQAFKEEKARRARKSLLRFSKYTDADYQANWHHIQLMNKLQETITEKNKRIIVSMPPRHGKSEIISRKYPAYALGQNPNLKILGTSYSAELASSMNRDVQRIMDTDTYRDIYPQTVIPTKGIQNDGYTRNNDLFEVIGYKGSYRSAGVGGSITGQGADIAIIDDPVKNRAEAESKVYRDKIYDWFTSTLYTRLEKDASIIIVLTRWHEDDLAGRLLDLAKHDEDAEQWEVISYPALFDTKHKSLDPTDTREDGEPLWKEKYDVQALNRMRATMGTYEWSALYQQQPTPESGGIFKRDWFMYYKYLPKYIDEWIQSWDLTFKDTDGSDYVVGQVWARKGANKYLVEQTRAKMNITSTMQAIRNMSNKYPQAKAKLVEDKANGPAVISLLEREIPGLIPVEPEGGKIVRARAVTPEIESGNVYLPQNAVWLQDFIEEVASFPNGMHDDQVDGMTQALNRIGTIKPAGISGINIW